MSCRYDTFDKTAVPIIGTLVVTLLLPEMHRFASLAWSTASSSITIETDLMTLVGVATAGFLAQLVDGALGMGYGLTSSTVLVAAGLSPRTASEVVHLAQLGTTLVSGLAHHRCGTVDWPTAWRVAVPGVVGALVGASLLSSLPVAAAKTMASVLLLCVGLYLFVRFYSPTPPAANPAAKPRALLLAPIGLVGGFIDVAGGGGWGPVATCGLLAEGRLPPSRVIGTVSMSEFFVTVAAVAGFCLTSSSGGLGLGAVRLDLMLTLLLGGLLAAPIAPLLVTKLDSQVLGVIVGGFICLTNARVLLKAASVPSKVCSTCLALLACVWLAASLRVATRGSSKVQGRSRAGPGQVQG